MLVLNELHRGRAGEVFSSKINNIMSYTDWIELVELSIPNKNRLSILEFGLGEGTKYLLDNFEFVYSHELAAKPKYYDSTVQKFSKSRNWKHELVLFSDIGFVDFNPDLPKVLLSGITKLFNRYKFDVVLVDGNYHVRGDIANFILNKFHPKYVIIHDINLAFKEDGYDRIKLPPKYESVSSNVGEGTRIFVKNS